MINVNYNPDVLDAIANLSNDEVFTPPKLVNEILDMLPQKLFASKTTTFLDPVSKSGVFLREIAKRLMKGLKSQIPDKQERANHIFQKQIFGIAITELTSLLSRRTVYGTKTANNKYSFCTEFEDEQGNIIFNKKQKHTWQNGKCTFCGASQEVYDRADSLETYAYQFIHTNKPEKIFNMKFDVIIGNPPYQLNDGGGTGSSAKPIYHLFVQQAKKLNPRYLTMIIPARWFTGGKGLDDFRKSMLEDKQIKVLHDFVNASECFPNVSIEGGVCYFLWGKNHNNKCSYYLHNSDGNTVKSYRYLNKTEDVFVRDIIGVNVYNKVKKLNEESFKKIVSSRNPYGISSDFLKKNKSLFINNKDENCYNVLGILNKQRTVKKVSKTFKISRNLEEIKKFRIFASKADGAAGQIGNPIPARIIGQPVLAKPNDICTETFLRIGTFSSKEEALNAIKYMKTKFFRFLVGLRKNKNMTKDTFSFVPIQDFTQEWTDEKLYKKYGLTQEEIDFIESMIRPMD